MFWPVSTEQEISTEVFSISAERKICPVLGSLRRPLSQLIPVALGQFADRCLPRVQVNHALLWTG